MLQPHPFLHGSPTALRKSPYWAKVMSGSGSSRSHCFRTPVIAWMGKSSSLTAAGSVRQGHVSIVCVLTSGAALGHLLPSAYLSAVPGVIPVSGWQRPTCGKGPRYTGHASLRVPEASPAQWAQRPCHWSGCSHTLRSGLVRHPAHSTVWDGWRVRPGCHFLSVFHLSLPTLSLKGCLRGGNLLHEAPIGWMSLPGE